MVVMKRPLNRLQTQTDVSIPSNFLLPPVMLPDRDLHGQITVISRHTSILMSQTKHLNNSHVPAPPDYIGTKCRDLHLPTLRGRAGLAKMASGEPELLRRTQLDHQPLEE